MIDVAQAAGVSIATVSAFINGTSNVSPELTQRIEAAIARIGYQRNAIARSLKIGTTRTIGLTVADIRNPFFTDVVATIQQVLNKAGYAVMLCSNDEDAAKQDDQIKLLLDRMVDGLIIAPAGEDEIMKRLVTSARKPAVLIDRVCEGLDIDAVVLDNLKALFDVTNYLISLGHRRIGFLSGPADTSTGRDRLAGYRKAFEVAGMEFPGDLVRNGSYREADGYRATMQLLTMPDRPTAIVSANNLMVIGAMRAIRDMGLSCPADISVASMDDFPWADVFSPRLTAVAQPVEAIGEQAATLLLERLQGRAPDSARKIVLHGRLVVRESCAPLGIR